MESGILPFLIVAIAIALFLMIVLIFGVVGYIQKKKVQFILEREREKARFEEQLLTSKMEISEQNLKNISWELHDNIGQILSLASMQSKILLRKTEIDKADVEEISKLISDGLGQTRLLSSTLNHESIQHKGLVESIRTELNRLERLNILTTQLNISGEVNMDNNKEIIIFRILQEFISNVVKHAQASELIIDIDVVDKALKIAATDNGKGFIEEEINKSNGIINMHSRAKLIGAELSLMSKLNQGTSLTIELPLH